MGSDDHHHRRLVGRTRDCGSIDISLVTRHLSVIGSNPRLRPQSSVIQVTVLVVRIDINFRTLFGKFVGGLCALSGIFILTLPIPIVVNSFGNFYKNRLWRSEVELKRRERMRLRSSEKREVENTQIVYLQE